MKKAKTLGVILTLGSAIFWSLNSNLLKVIYQEGVDPMLIAGLRTGIAALILFVVLLSFTKTRRMLFNFPKSSIKYLFFLGLVFVVSVVTWVYAISLTSIANVVLLGNISTILTVILAHFFLKEDITKLKIFAVVISFAGIFIITFPAYNVNLFSSETFWGDCIALIHSLFWAFWYLLSKKLGKDTVAIVTTTWSLLVAGIILLPWSIYGVLHTSTSLKAWLLIIVTAILAQCVGTLMLHQASRYIEASIISILILTETVMAPLLAYYMFDEVPAWYTYLGGGVIMIAVAVIVLAKDKK